LQGMAGLQGRLPVAQGQGGIIERLPPPLRGEGGRPRQPPCPPVDLELLGQRGCPVAHLQVAARADALHYALHDPTVKTMKPGLLKASKPAGSVLEYVL